ncbi:protein ALTERED PHOSPHATE STARVATION RESPONSE 1-like isoform X3 [Triticum dicoccoides]|uniref:protein ALTERED PHOSPHATE STARVATION RESPONSE 1-like isoform X3 n=1 Tax=Triticum dicoccoides TaxID=85692 RepID=UPI000E7C4728|nr:protein ALTERED PHOSPHATE STARVATION RESPONSE 1-like isoform X3 [Triticum dicoccoides]XP_044369395.1 protein ALTERED PHOSPHATE STARVATION RESPONSE 1-like isoform X3 [Triticum aestivum]
MEMDHLAGRLAAASVSSTDDPTPSPATGGDGSLLDVICAVERAEGTIRNQNYERLKQEHDKKVGLLRKQEVRGMDYLKMEKNKMEMESLESKMLVATQSIDTTTSEIIRLRESELFPQR